MDRKKSRFPVMRQILAPACLAALLLGAFPPQTAAAERLSVAELKLITQAGGALIIDLESQPLTVVQLADLAASLKFQATLTIKMGRKPLTATQCAQVARARPGQVIFWF